MIQVPEIRGGLPTFHHHRRVALEAKMVNGRRQTHWVCSVCRADLGWE